MSGTEVFLLRSTDTGAPTLTGTAGSLIALLDACLVNGYNSKTVTIARTGATATATCATAHGLAADGLTKVKHSGAAQAEYNGNFKIFNVTTLTYDFTVTGTPATPATGTITAKVAPVGWEKPSSSSNAGAYRSLEATATKMVLAITDNNTNADSYKSAALRGWELLANIWTETGAFGAVNSIIYKSTASDSSTRKWVLVGDGFEFCFFWAAYPATYPNQYDFFHFGDPASEMASDPYGCLIFGPYTAAPSIPGHTGEAATTVNALGTVQANHYMARGYAQTGGQVNVGKLSGYSLAGNNIFGSGNMAYPAPHNNGLYVAPVFIGDPAAIVRAQLKCIYNPLHTRPLGHGGTVSNLSNLPGRTLYAIAISSGATAYEVLVDTTGPWR